MKVSLLVEVETMPSLASMRNKSIGHCWGWIVCHTMLLSYVIGLDLRLDDKWHPNIGIQGINQHRERFDWQSCKLEVKDTNYNYGLDDIGMWMQYVLIYYRI